MADKRLIDKVDDSSLVEYAGAKKLAVVLCLDMSQSMNTVVDNTNTVPTGEYGTREDGSKVQFVTGGVTRMNKLTEGVNQVVRHLLSRKDIQAEQIEIATVLFNENIYLENPFVSLNNYNASLLPKSGTGQTHLGEAVLTSLDLIEKRISQYVAKEIGRYRPWLLVFTDGEDRGNPNDMQKAIQRANDLENAGKIMTYCFGINDKELNLETLKLLNNNYSIHPFEAVNLDRIFEIISYALGQTATGQIGNPKIKIDEDIRRYLGGQKNG